MDFRRVAEIDLEVDDVAHHPLLLYSATFATVAGITIHTHRVDALLEHKRMMLRSEI